MSYVLLYWSYTVLMLLGVLPYWFVFIYYCFLTFYCSFLLIIILLCFYYYIRCFINYNSGLLLYYDGLQSSTAMLCLLLCGLSCFSIILYRHSFVPTMPQGILHLTVSYQRQSASPLPASTTDIIHTAI